VKASSEGGAGRRNRAALRKAAGRTNRGQVVRGRRKRVSAFSEEIVGDITSMINNAGPEVRLFEKQKVDFISDLHEFVDYYGDAVPGPKRSKETPGYETPTHTELMSQLPPFPGTVAVEMLADAESEAPAPIARVAPASVCTADGRSVQISFPAGSTSGEVSRTFAAAFGLATCSFVLRDSTGCVVPTSEASLGGQFTLEVPSVNAGTLGLSSSSLKFLQEPPHSAAVWLHTKLTKKGEIAGACRHHVFSPAPKVALADFSGGDASADNREALLAKATVTLVNAAGEEAVDKNGKPVMHTGTPVIRTDPVTNACTITWPEMAVLDTSRTVHGMPAKALKVSAKECGGYRGAVGWFSLKVSVPGCEDLWLKNSVTGQRAKIIIKNERNAALGWAEKAEGPYADHSRCVPSHIDAKGNRLCRHGCGGGTWKACGSRCTKIKTEPA